MSKVSIYILLWCCTLFVSCEYFQSNEERKVLAKVHDKYLYEEDVVNLIPKGSSAQDSVLFMSNYINRWAQEELFMHQAKINLSEEKQRDFKRLVDLYRNELYTEAYKDIVISGMIDTTFQDTIIENYFEANKINFKLNQDLIMLRYIELEKDYLDVKELKKKITRFDQDDKIDIEEESLKFKNYSLNDSVWVKPREIYKKITPLDASMSDEFLKKENFLQLEDSLGVYLVYIKDVLKRNDQAPLEYVKPTIKQILLNRRKLELSKELEKEIIKDAIKQKKFEIYN
ncbi:peptidyl-prolyl cis-trans isomerase [Mesonia ostreae]|uniref:Peptidyl-prolyl cis-trans isomerase n=1 Tax=Mesonia ostreae TaxID=861110 RepID=A0ABU2KK65_9FLAO|nr:peptidyl-prolyl cis-trans isomerase [Mesonia ostreae]MDT0295086.1 peptidyl-prolyl cis-trans isomerase [Mesonia ostreae]